MQLVGGELVQEMFHCQCGLIVKLEVPTFVWLKGRYTLLAK